MSSAPSLPNNADLFNSPWHEQWSDQWRVYGEQARRRSRNCAALGMFGLFSAMLALCAFQPQKSISLPAMERRVVMVMEQLPPPVPKAKEPELKKIVAEDSDFLIPEEPKLEPKPEPVVEKPKPVPPPPPVKEKPKPKPKPKPKAKPAPKPEPVKKAVEEVKGVENAAPTAVPAAVGNARAEASRESAVLAAILQTLEKHKRYPRAGRRSGAEGTCGLMVRIGPDGKVVAAEVQEKSGKSVLDAAASRLGEKLVGLYVGSAGALNVLVPVHYRLTDR